MRPGSLDWRLILIIGILAVLGGSLYVDAPTGRAPLSTHSLSSDRPAIGQPIWTSTRALTSEENAELHFRKHGKGMGFKTRDEYVRKATEFLHHPPADAIRRQQPDGDTEIYRPSTHEFAVMNRSGIPRTYFIRTRFPSDQKPMR